MAGAQALQDVEMEGPPDASGTAGNAFFLNSIPDDKLKDHYLVNAVSNRQFEKENNVFKYSDVQDNKGLQGEFKYVKIYVPKSDTLADLPVTELNPMSDYVFFNQLSDLTNDLHGNIAMLYVHGFNTSLKNSSFYAARLQYLQQCELDTYLFDWACPMRLNRDAFTAKSDYVECKNRISNNDILQQLYDLLKVILGKYDKVLIVCHSMGCHLFTKMLNRFQILFEKLPILKMKLIYFAGNVPVKDASALFNANQVDIINRYNPGFTLLTGDLILSMATVIELGTLQAGRNMMEHWRNIKKPDNAVKYGSHSYLLDRLCWEPFLINHKNYFFGVDLQDQVFSSQLSSYLKVHCKLADVIPLKEEDLKINKE
eukprot:NODE_75_length_23955_cov_0.435069.p5 type:complete len:370 gc:universal NODE_75_length_23955_cov_0.435069:11666-12775(+)